MSIATAYVAHVSAPGPLTGIQQPQAPRRRSYAPISRMLHVQLMGILYWVDTYLHRLQFWPSRGSDDTRNQHKPGDSNAVRLPDPLIAASLFPSLVAGRFSEVE